MSKKFEKYSLISWSKNKYLVFALTDKNKRGLENYYELWDEIKE